MPPTVVCASGLLFLASPTNNLPVSRVNASSPTVNVPRSVLERCGSIPLVYRKFNYSIIKDLNVIALSHELSIFKVENLT